jgi:hypothetical protein
MTWEWLPPVGTIVGAMITAGVGGWLGGRRSRKDQEAQHRFEREQALTEHGRDKVDDAISALRFLQRHSHEVVEGDFALPDAEPSDVATHYERLVQAIPYLTDKATRNDIELVHEIVADGLFKRYTGPSVARRVVWRACGLGLAVLGRYLRGEPWEPSEELTELRRDHGEYAQIYAEEMEANAAAEQKWRKSQAAAQRKRREQAPEV